MNTQSIREQWRAVAIALTCLSLGTCLESQPVTAQTARIETVKGRVQLKRDRWSTFQPVRAGTALYQGDELLPDQGTRVLVVCPDLSKRPVSAGVRSGLKRICPKWEVLLPKAPPAPGVLGGINANLPYVIAPRHTLLLSHLPTLSWNQVAGATQYTVRILATNFSQEFPTKTAQLKVLGTLREAVPYTFTVRTNTGKSSQDEQTTNLDFRILRTTEASVVRSQADKIRQQTLSQQTTALLLADLYSHYLLPESAISAYGLTTQTFKTYNLTADAIAALESVLQQGEKTPIIYRTLGDLYWQSGLARLAESQYLKAIALAKSPADLEEKTLAEFGLGEVNAATGNSPLAKQWYIRAIQGYLALGDAQRAAFLKQQLDTIEP